MDNFSICSRQVTGLSSCRAAAYILLVHDHRGVTYAAHGRSVCGMTFGVGCRIALKDDRSLAVYRCACLHAMHCDGKLAALESFAERGAALDVFRQRLRMLVIGMIAADG
jgi:hypothetical protein